MASATPGEPARKTAAYPPAVDRPAPFDHVAKESNDSNK